MWLGLLDLCLGGLSGGSVAKSCRSEHDAIAVVRFGARVVTMRPWIEGTVSILRCEGDGHLSPYLTFSGDTDMVTDGFASLSSIIRDEIVVAEMAPQEFDDEKGKAFQGRINSILDRTDLRFVRLRRVENVTSPAGSSFQNFRQSYAPPRLVFVCPRCDFDAVAERSATPSDYKRAGGTLTVVADLEIRDRPPE